MAGADIEARIKQAILRRPQEPDWQVGKRVRGPDGNKLHAADVAAVRAKMMQGAVAECAEGGITARPFSELRHTFDRSYLIPQRIQAVIDKHLQDGRWLYDQEMRQLVECPTQFWRRYAEQFAANTVTIGGKTIWVDAAKRDEVERMKLA